MCELTRIEVAVTGVAAAEAPVGPERPPSRPGNRVDMHGFAVHGVHVRPLEMFTDLRGNPNRAEIIGSDEADDTVDLRVFPDPFKGGCRRLRRKAVPPS
jgi:hypothetical protein